MPPTCNIHILWASPLTIIDLFFDSFCPPPAFNFLEVLVAFIDKGSVGLDKEVKKQYNERNIISL
jgi:hypothetical protein